jgi:hypothetical protein
MFMQTFNAWYYSWAPSLTYTAGRNDLFLHALRVGVYPLIGILYVGYFSYALVSPISAEAGAIVAGVVAASLIGLVYVAPVAYVSLWLVRRRTKLLIPAKVHLLPVYGWVAASALLMSVAHLLGSAFLMGLGTFSGGLSMVSVGSIFGTLALTSLELPVVNLQAKIFSYPIVNDWMEKYTALMEKYKITPQLPDAWATDERFLKVKGFVDNAVNWLGLNARSFSYLLPDALEITMYLFLVSYFVMQVGRQQA